jgi:hypothetical protein
MLKRYPTGQQLRIHQHKLTAQMEFSNVDFMFPPFSDCFMEGFRAPPLDRSHLDLCMRSVRRPSGFVQTRLCVGIRNAVVPEWSALLRLAISSKPDFGTTSSEPA